MDYIRKTFRVIGINRIIVLSVISLLFGMAWDLSYRFNEPDAALSINVFNCLKASFLYFLIILIIVVTIINYRNTEVVYYTYNKQYKFITTNFFLLLSIHILTYVIFWPGVGNADTLYILKSDLGKSSQHPWFYCLIIKILKGVIHQLTGSYNYKLVVSICAIFQIITAVLLECYILYSLYKENAHPLLLIFAEIYYFLSPTLIIYSFTVIKDIPFSLALTAFIICLKKLYFTPDNCIDKKQLIITFSLMAFLILCRNNGIYIVIITILGLLIYRFKEYKKILILLAGCICIVLISNAVVKKIGKEHLFKETAGVPLQQIAAVIAKDGRVYEEQSEFINNVMPLNDIKERYNPYTVDAIKWGGSSIDDKYLNNNKIQFLKVWAQLLPDNFDIYVESYLKLTYGFWSVSENKVSHVYISLFDNGFNNSNKKWIKNNNITRESYISTPLRDLIAEGGRRFLGEGQCIWILVSCLIIMYCSHQKKEYLWIYSPLWTLCLTLMVSLPIYHQWRYIYAIPLCLPLLLHHTIGKKSADNDFSTS